MATLTLTKNAISRSIELLDTVNDANAINVNIGNYFAELTTDVSLAGDTPRLKFTKNGTDYWIRETFATAVPYLILQSDTDFTLSVSVSNWDGSLYYSTDANNWSVWNGDPISSANSVLYLRGEGNTQINSRLLFVDATNLRAIGNVENLLDWETVAQGVHPEMAIDCFNQLFHSCSSLVQAPELPATTLSSRCYSWMFFRTNIVQAPVLPATRAALGCYSNMFRACPSLVYCPELPATTLHVGCYGNMFLDCPNLLHAPDLPATTMTMTCYRTMLQGCSSIRISTTQDATYTKPWRLPTVGSMVEVAQEWNSNMLTNTGGTFTGDPEINTTYYQAE